MPGEFPDSVLPSFKQRSVYNGCTNSSGRYQSLVMMQRDLLGPAACLLGMKPPIYSSETQDWFGKDGWKNLIGKKE